MESGEKAVNLYTDGACSYNPGPGGWGVILNNAEGKGVFGRGGKHHQQPDGADRRDRGAFGFKEPAASIYTPFPVCGQRVNKAWRKGGNQPAGKRPIKKPALNADLGLNLLTLMETHEVSITWIKGHAGHPKNERCDKLATDYIQMLKEKV